MNNIQVLYLLKRKKKSPDKEFKVLDIKKIGFQIK